MKKLLLCALLLFVAFSAFYSCDTTTEPENILEDVPSIIGFNIIPSKVNFTQQKDGFKDTTLTLYIEAIVENFHDGQLPQFAITPKSTNKTIVEGELTQSETTGTFIENVQFETTTATYEDYIVNVFLINEYGKGNYAQAVLDINGFSNFRPEIVDTTSPGTIVRPSSGSVPAVFTATVADADGDETIERVFLRIIDQETGEVSGSPFEMSDDGMSLGDETANDMVYTWAFGVPANPESGRIERDYDIEFFAVDRGGLYSDTLRTTFHIRGN